MSSPWGGKVRRVASVAALAILIPVAAWVCFLRDGRIGVDDRPIGPAPVVNDLTAAEKDRLRRAEGLLVGICVADALAAPAEFLTPERIREEYGEGLEKLEAMAGGGSIGWAPGQGSDETDMVFAVARSIASKKEWDPDDVARRLTAWYLAGPKDVGGLTGRALGRIATGEHWRDAGFREAIDSGEGRNAGNGGLIRSLPLAIALDGDALDGAANDCSAITHADPRCTDAARILTRIASDLLRGERARVAVEAARAWAREHSSLYDKVIGEAIEKPPSECPATGYVVDAVRISISALLHSSTFREGVLAVVARGNDADSNAAAAAGLLGAALGAGAIPEAWVERVPAAAEARELARHLFALRKDATPRTP